MEKNDTTYTLLRSFINNKLERPQLAELFALLEYVDEEQLHNAIQSILDEDEPGEEDAGFIQERVNILRQNIIENIESPEKGEPDRWQSFKRWGLGIAATLVIAFAVGYLVQQRDNELLSDDGYGVASTIMPGMNKATITVNGADFQLDTNQRELVLSADGFYYGDGTLLTATDAQRSITVKTPLGGQYQLILADGSKVWLNAGSEMSYTEGFGKADRRLSLQGEAYFEVAKNENIPFIVHVKGQEIRVLGTAFNVNAYSDESLVKTTLQEGSLVVSNDKQKFVLKPNQQAVLDKEANKMATRDVNAVTVIAWKDGIFNFHGMSLEECLRIIARWYKLDVVYTEKIPSILLGGKMSRGVKLSTFLTFLEVNFNIHGEVTADRKLVITVNKT